MFRGSRGDGMKFFDEIKKIKNYKLRMSRPELNKEFWTGIDSILEEAERGNENVEHSTTEDDELIFEGTLHPSGMDTRVERQTGSVDESRGQDIRGHQESFWKDYWKWEYSRE